jgi:hypothetical protein
MTRDRLTAFALTSCFRSEAAEMVAPIGIAEWAEESRVSALAFLAGCCEKGAAQKLTRKFVILVLLWLFGAARFCRADDSQYRSEVYLKLFDEGWVNFTVWGQVGFSDSTPNPSRYMFGPKLAFNPWEHWTFGVNYSYFEKQTYYPKLDDFRPLSEHRAEFEIDNHWDLNERVELNLRNRLEQRWFIETGATDLRSRHRAEFVFPLKHCGSLTALFSSAEFFYDWDNNRNSENRVVPLGLTFKLSERLSLKTFYMWQSIHQVQNWTQSHVLYTQLYFTF